VFLPTPRGFKAPGGYYIRRYLEGLLFQVAFSVKHSDKIFFIVFIRIYAYHVGKYNINFVAWLFRKVSASLIKKRFPRRGKTENYRTILKSTPYENNNTLRL